MESGDYCTKICRSKCCKTWQGTQVTWVCPNLEETLLESKCKIYDTWKDQGTCGQYFPEVGNAPMNIQQAIQRKLLPIFVENQCCFAHEELLNGN